MAKFSFSKNKTATQLTNFLAPWLLFAAVVWLCWGLAKLLWLFVAPPMAPNLAEVPRQYNNDRQNDVSSSFMIFENTQQPQQSSVSPPNFALKGVMVAKPSYISSALIDVNGEIKNYHIEDSIGDGQYKLQAVDWNYITVADDYGNQHELSLTQPFNLDQSDQMISGFSNSQGISNDRLSPDMSSSDNVAVAPEQTMQEPDPVAAGIKQFQENPADFLSNMGVIATGDGYQISESTPPDISTRLGLEPGDKVISVNGQVVGNDLMADADLLTQIQFSGQAEIKVQRGDQEIVIRQQF